MIRDDKIEHTPQPSIVINCKTCHYSGGSSRRCLICKAEDKPYKYYKIRRKEIK